MKNYDRNILESAAKSSAEIFKQKSNAQILSPAQVATQLANFVQEATFPYGETSYKSSASMLSAAAKAVELLCEKDFRIGVASQEINNELKTDPENVIESLLFKETSTPTTEFESKFFEILEQQRKILRDHTDILKEINESKAQNVPEKPSDEKHSSPAFYEDKMWGLEQIASAIIGAIIGEIISSTIGIDTTNMIGLVLLLGCLLNFIKNK
ncbi:hypothetical protein [Enterococcus innesii]|uniref:hypothetical protein n=1 Tax=Enterococcus innesii TaxID=2839759 RepID=UPI0022B9A6D5|nr:hypothetical protein [Enterococcus innesii]